MPLPPLVELTDENFDEKIQSLREPVLVDFWADWCGPCRLLQPTLHDLAREMAGRIVFAQVDVDASGDLVNRFGIRSVPTLMVFKGGKVVDQIVGNVPKEEIVSLLAKHWT